MGSYKTGVSLLDLGKECQRIEEESGYSHRKKEECIAALLSASFAAASSNNLPPHQKALLQFLKRMLASRFEYRTTFFHELGEQGVRLVCKYVNDTVAEFQQISSSKSDAEMYTIRVKSVLIYTFLLCSEDLLEGVLFPKENVLITTLPMGVFSSPESGRIGYSFLRIDRPFVEDITGIYHLM